MYTCIYTYIHIHIHYTYIHDAKRPPPLDLASGGREVEDQALELYVCVYTNVYIYIYIYTSLYIYIYIQIVRGQRKDVGLRAWPRQASC